MTLSAIDKVKNALLTVSQNVGHFEAANSANPPYIVWAEDNEFNGLSGDDYKLGQTLEGTIDLFTKDENDALFDAIQGALVAAKVYFRLESVQYEDDTELIHYEWTWRVMT